MALEHIFFLFPFRFNKHTAQGLGGCPYTVLLHNPNNQHCFLPWTYSVLPRGWESLLRPFNKELGLSEVK